MVISCSPHFQKFGKIVYMFTFRFFRKQQHFEIDGISGVYLFTSCLQVNEIVQHLLFTFFFTRFVKCKH